MIPAKDLNGISRARLKDAQALLAARRYDGGAYLCGYAIELALKARICKTLRWTGYPATRTEFLKLGSFKVHDLDALLHLSGREHKVRLAYLAEWSDIVTWNPSMRYNQVGTVKRDELVLMIRSTQTILAVV